MQGVSSCLDRACVGKRGRSAGNRGLMELAQDAGNADGRVVVGGFGWCLLSYRWLLGGPCARGPMRGLVRFEYDQLHPVTVHSSADTVAVKGLAGSLFSTERRRSRTSSPSSCEGPTVTVCGSTCLGGVNDFGTRRSC